MYTPANERLTITDYVRILDRHKWTIAFVLAVCILLTLWHNSKLVPIYSARTTMIIDRETRAPIPGQERDYQSYLSETLTFQTHYKMITSLPVLERVVEILELDKKDTRKQQEEVEKIFPFRQYITTFKKNVRAILDRFLSPAPDGSDDDVSIPLENPKTVIARSLRGVITVEQVEETRLFNITVTHTNPEMARDVANALAQAYIDFNIETRVKASQNTLNWLGRNLEEMKVNLEKAEKEFTDFKQREQLVSIEKNQEIITRKITEFNDAFIAAKSRRLEIETKLDKLKQISGSQGGIPQLRSLVSNELIDSLYSELLAAEVELSKLSNVYKEKHPKIVEIKTKIANIKSTINDEIKKEIYKLETERTVLLSKEKVIQDTIADFKKEAMETGKKELGHNILKRNVEMNQRLYDALLSSLKEADLAKNLDVSNIRIMEKALLPASPIGPDKKRNLILSVLIGLMLGVTYSFSWEFLDRSFKTEEEAQKYLKIPVLGIIPKTNRKAR